MHPSRYVFIKEATKTYKDMAKNFIPVKKVKKQWILSFLRMIPIEYRDTTYCFGKLIQNATSVICRYDLYEQNS